MLAIEFAQGIEDAWADVAAFIPKLIGFLLILVIGWFIVKAIAKIADAALERVGFDRAVERGGIKQAMAKSKYDASTIVSKVIFYALFLMVLQMAFGVFGENPISDLLAGVIAYLPKVLAAIAIIVIAAAIGAALKTLVENTLGGLSYGKPLAIAAGAAPVVIGVFAALDQLQIAEDIVRMTYMALLALIVGSGIIAIGGSGIQPMRQYWERALNKIDEEAPRIKDEAKAKQSQERRDLTGSQPAPEQPRATTVQERVTARTDI